MQIARTLIPIAAVAAALFCVPSADGAVGFRSRTCSVVDANSISLARPTGTAAGDVLIASLGSENGAISPPTGWTLVPGLSGALSQGQNQRTYYRVAGGSEPANYVFTGATSNAMTGSVSAFTGASITTPVHATAVQTINNTAVTEAVLPNATGSYVGSMRYSSVAADDVADNMTFTAPMSRLCNVGTAQSSDVAFASAYEPTGVGTTSTRSVFLNDNAGVVMHTLVINPACTGGSLGLASPGSIDFGTVVLTGLDEPVSTVDAFDVTDDTGSNSGWSISATSTTFTNGPHSFPTNATHVTGGAASANAGTCSAPSNSVSYPFVLPAGAVAPPAAKVFNAAAGTGRGTHDVDISHGLLVPASASTGVYSSTWTWTIATGP